MQVESFLSYVDNLDKQSTEYEALSFLSDPLRCRKNRITAIHYAQNIYWNYIAEFARYYKYKKYWRLISFNNRHGIPFTRVNSKEIPIPCKEDIVEVTLHYDDTENLYLKLYYKTVTFRTIQTEDSLYGYRGVSYQRKEDTIDFVYVPIEKIIYFDEEFKEYKDMLKKETKRIRMENEK